MAMKTENGVEYPLEAYLVVPDPDSPSTWKLRIWESPDLKITIRQLGRAAAALGPGFRGNRVDLPEEERRQAARKLIRLYRQQEVEDEEIPRYLFEIAGLRPPSMAETDYIEREAMLFEAGNYPDKGISVTEEDIANLAQTEGDIPIYVEHAKSPIRLGSVHSLYQRGKQLWGKLRLLPEAFALLERLGIKSLSVSVPRTLDRIIEVSVTGSPRVQGAQIFHFSLGETPKEVIDMQDQTQEMEQLRQQLMQLEERNRALERALKLMEAQQEVDALIHAGQMPPVFREPMIALRAGLETVQFSNREMPLSEAFMEAWRQQPSIQSTIQGKVNGSGNLVNDLMQLGFSKEIAELAAQTKAQEG